MHRRLWKNIKRIWGKVWYFLWEEDSLLSWFANIVLAFLIIKFLFYPVLGLALGTSYPVVAVISSSMEHNTDFDSWWDPQASLYSQYSINKEQFSKFIFTNGFNKGDIIVLTGVSPEKIHVGDVIVFQSSAKEPIIHRVVEVYNENSEYFFHTKGDHNTASLSEEMRISENRLIGRAVFKIPYLGWLKLGFTNLFQFLANTSTA